MARTIEAVESEMILALKTKYPNLSSSATAFWRLIAHVVAVAIYNFALLLDNFRDETEELTRRITPGTLRWYAQMCRRFQMGHELVFDNSTAMLYYERDDPKARIIDVVAVSDINNRIAIKVARIAPDGAVKPLTADELHNFSGYINTIKFVGIDTSVISTEADVVRYNMEVFYDPIQPRTTVETQVKTALQEFKRNLNFDSTLYAGRLSDCVMHIPGVMTVNMVSLERKSVSETEFTPVGIFCELAAGYFDWDKDVTLTLTPIK